MLKKGMSILLALAMLIAMASMSLVSAVDTCTCGECPIIYVTGIANKEILRNPGAEDETIIFPPSTDGILEAVKGAVLPIGIGALDSGWEGVGEALAPAAKLVMDDFALNVDGTVPEDQGIDWEWPVISLAEGHENEYSFYYDWRQDPMITAADLSDFVDYVLENTGHEKASFNGFSMGSAILNAYLYLLDGDYSKINAIVLEVPGCNGVTCAGQPLSGEVAFDPASLARFIDESLLANDGTGLIISTMLQAFVEAGVLLPITDFANSAVVGLTDAIYGDAVADAFATMPGLWSLVPDDYYEAAKDTMLADTEKYGALIEKIDFYHYNVQLGNDARATELFNNPDINFAIVCKYGLQVAPVVEDSAVMTDGVVDTKYASFGATCADLGTDLGEGYVQAVDCGHNHLSADNKIDASTCVLPEATWFIKNQQHSNSTDYSEALVQMLYAADGQVTVFDDPAYPQFVLYDGETDTAAPLTIDNTGETVDFLKDLGLNSRWTIVLVNLINAFSKLIDMLFRSNLE